MNVLHPESILVPSDGKQTPCLLGSRCDKCGTVVFPRMPVCPACLTNGAMQTAEIGRTAKLYSHTIAHFAPKGFKAPFFQVFVDLPEGPRIFSLVGAECPVEPNVLEDGMDMQLVLEPLANTPENKHIITYKYVPTCMLDRSGKARHA